MHLATEMRQPSVEELEWLLLARQEDPYRDFARRQVYERVAALEGAQKRIPAGPLKGAQAAICVPTRDDMEELKYRTHIYYNN